MKEKHATIANEINYAGKVSVSIMDGKRRLRTITHNNGKKGLFNFLSNCLLGNFTAAKSSYPSRIACFGIGDASSDSLKKLSSYVRYDSSRWDEENEESASGSAIYFHFRIPYTLLEPGQISVLRLYTDKPSGPDVEESICAEVALEEAINVPDYVDGNFTIIVDWKLTLTDIEPTTRN